MECKESGVSVQLRDFIDFYIVFDKIFCIIWSTLFQCTFEIFGFLLLRLLVQWYLYSGKSWKAFKPYILKYRMVETQAWIYAENFKEERNRFLTPYEMRIFSAMNQLKSDFERKN